MIKVILAALIVTISVIGVVYPTLLMIVDKRYRDSRIGILDRGLTGPTDFDFYSLIFGVFWAIRRHGFIKCILSFGLTCLVWFLLTIYILILVVALVLSLIFGFGVAREYTLIDENYLRAGSYYLTHGETLVEFVILLFRIGEVASFFIVYGFLNCIINRSSFKMNVVFKTSISYFSGLPWYIWYCSICSLDMIRFRSDLRIHLYPKYFLTNFILYYDQVFRHPFIQKKSYKIYIKWWFSLNPYLVWQKALMYHMLSRYSMVNPYEITNYVNLNGRMISHTHQAFVSRDMRIAAILSHSDRLNIGGQRVDGFRISDNSMNNRPQYSYYARVGRDTEMVPGIIGPFRNNINFLDNAMFLTNMGLYSHTTSMILRQNYRIQEVERFESNQRLISHLQVEGDILGSDISNSLNEAASRNNIYRLNNNDLNNLINHGNMGDGDMSDN